MSRHFITKHSICGGTGDDDGDDDDGDDDIEITNTCAGKADLVIVNFNRVSSDVLTCCGTIRNPAKDVSQTTDYVYKEECRNLFKHLFSIGITSHEKQLKPCKKHFGILKDTYPFRLRNNHHSFTNDPIQKGLLR